jgi:3-phenylpropionate/trans-cinnamate dioxygenase ferredoxin reductase subunit
MVADTTTAGMVIVGAGECGARAALGLREAGYQGPVTLIGDEPHVPYERPPLSKETLTEGAGPQPKGVSGHERLTEAGIDFRPSVRVARIDRSARRIDLEGGASLAYDKLLLATGATPRRLPLAEGVAGCFYLRTFDDAVTIRSFLSRGMHLAVIGGGFIGLELAASARKLGCPVTVIEAQPRILMRGVPEEVATSIHAAHAAQGVHLRCGETILSIEPANDCVRIVLSDGSTVDAGLIVIGIGVIPDVALASEAGLAIENGIVVDDRLFTSDPDIFAAGDCCSFTLPIYDGRRVRLESWRNAQEQGSLVAHNMLGANESYAAVPWFWSDQYELGLQVAGLGDEGVTTTRRDIDEATYLLFHLNQNGRVVAASGIGPGTSVARDIRLAEMLIARRATPSPGQLADPAVKLKSLLPA